MCTCTKHHEPLSVNMFSEHAIHVLGQYIRECEKRNDIEFEVRFSLLGRRNDAQREGHGHLHENSLLEEAIRGRIYRYLASIPNVNITETTTKESIYPEDKSGSLRRIESRINGRRYEHYMLKRRIKAWDDWSYNMRFSLASECKLINPFLNRGSILRRDKTRVSFTDPERPYVRYDLTRVTTYGKKGELPEVHYEFEVEWIKGKDGTSKDMTRILHEVLQVIQASSFVMTSKDINDTRKEYFQLVNKRHFVGAQPESLQMAHLEKLIKTRYSVTVKLDGERVLVHIRKDGKIILIDRLMMFRDTGLVCTEFPDTLLDAELTSNQQCHVFDILFLCHNDLRGKASMDLPSRMQEVSKVIGAIGSSRFVAKEYLWDTTDIPMVLSKGMAKGADGLIFTPVNQPYPLKSSCEIYKWKPASSNSIDFYVSRERADPLSPATYQLFVTNSDGSMDLFNKPEFGFNPSGLPSDFVSGVVECTLCESGSNFVAHRLRLDKIRPNHIRVVENVIESMLNPVTPELLLDVSEKRDHYGETKVSDFGVMRAYHNKVKGQLIQDAMKLCKKTQDIKVLDLACGRGGDMFKWDRSSVGLYVGVDVNQAFLDEAKERATKLLHIRPKFYQCDLETQSFHLTDYVAHKHSTSDESLSVPTEIDWSLLDEEFQDPASVDMTVDPHEPFDIVSLQFCLHYFFKNKDTFNTLFKTIDYSLSTNGIVIITTLDGNAIYDHIMTATEDESCGSFEVTENIKIRAMDLSNVEREDARRQCFGTALQVDFEGDPDMILTQYDKPEYVVFPDVLISLMASRGFALVSTSRFDGDDPSSKAYSNMNRSYVFQKMDYMNVEYTPGCSSYSNPWESLADYISGNLKMELPEENVRSFCIETLQKKSKYGLRQVNINGTQTDIVIDRTPWLLVDAFGNMLTNNGSFFHSL